ncbi:MAG TPA: hypothetical protein VMU82_19145, partial [Acetobacteraceae bacterium]|nr:hypothetical protein [Acetobacteraceae bacterium]
MAAIGRPFGGDNGKQLVSAHSVSGQEPTQDRGKSCTKNHVGLNRCAETSAARFSDTPQIALC